jgi:hypothetical protein
MKTIKFLSFVLFFNGSPTLFAVENPSMNIIRVDNGISLVAAENKNPAFFEVSIKNHEGDLVYHKKSHQKETRYKQLFDFSKLGDDDYNVTLRVNDTEISRNFKVSKNRMEIEGAKTKYDPFFSFNQGILKFSYLNFDKEPLTLTIYNQKEAIYSKKVGDNLAASGGYNLTKLEAGNYQIELSTPSKVYNYSIDK